MPHEDWYWCWDWLVRPTLRAARLVVRPAMTRRHRMEAGERCKWRIQCPRWFVRWWWRRRGGSVSGGGDDEAVRSVVVATTAKSGRARSVTIWRLRNWRERDRQTDGDRQTDSQTDRDRDRETERQRCCAEAAANEACRFATGYDRGVDDVYVCSASLSDATEDSCACGLHRSCFAWRCLCRSVERLWPTCRETLKKGRSQVA